MIRWGSMGNMASASSSLHLRRHKYFLFLSLHRHNMIIKGSNCSSSNPRSEMMRSFSKFNAAAAPAAALLAAAIIFSSTAADFLPLETLSNVPQTLSPDDGGGKQSRIQRPRSRKAESCTIKCVTTCIRSGDGEGPLNVRRPLVVFKQGFRSRQYCLAECSDICNLIKDGEDGP